VPEGALPGWTGKAGQLLAQAQRNAESGRGASALPGTRRGRGGSRTGARPGGRKKAACKWGPRVNGRCPPKPRAGAAEKTVAGLVGIRATTRGRQSVYVRAGRRLESRATTLAAGFALRGSKKGTLKLRRGLAKLAGPGVKGSIPAQLSAIAKRLAPKAAKLTGIGLAGAGAYALVRKTKAAGALPRFLAAQREKGKDLRARDFSKAVAAERKRGRVTAARVKQLAKKYGL